MDVLAWVVMGAVSWWLGIMSAGVRRDLALLDQRVSPSDDYALTSLLRRLKDDTVSLVLRLRISRVLAAIFLPLSLVAITSNLYWPGTVFCGLLGWFLAVGAELMGGGRIGRKLGRWRGGAGYSFWAKLTHPAARLARPVLGIRKKPDVEHDHALVMAEMQATLITAGGRLGREERRFLRRLLASRGILVADIQTRWESVIWTEAKGSLSETAGEIHRSGHSRLPVAKNGAVIGLITAKDVLPWVNNGSETEKSLGDLLRPVYFVCQEDTVKALLEELQEARTHMAVVLDRFGRPVGIVTMEDILEEIVGELHDERERKEERI